MVVILRVRDGADVAKRQGVEGRILLSVRALPLSGAFRPFRFRHRADTNNFDHYVLG